MNFTVKKVYDLYYTKNDCNTLYFLKNIINEIDTNVVLFSLTSPGYK